MKNLTPMISKFTRNWLHSATIGPIVAIYRLSVAHFYSTHYILISYKISYKWTQYFGIPGVWGTQGGRVNVAVHARHTSLFLN